MAALNPLGWWKLADSAGITTALDASGTAPTYGNNLTLTATLASTVGTASGTMAFTADGTTLTGCSAVAVSNNSATCSTSTLAAGSRNLVATFNSSDPNYANSTSSTLVQPIAGAATTTALTYGTSGGVSIYGQTASWNAAVSSTVSGTLSGTLTFSAGSTVLCTAVPLVSGTASCSSGVAPAGSPLVTAVFTSTASNYTGSTSNPLSQAVTTASTTSALTDSTGWTIPHSQPTTITDTVSPQYSGTPAGTATFYSGGVAITGCSSVTLTSGAAACTTSALATGTDSITATYTTGNSNFSGSSAPAHNLVVS
jgi:hypothetical protein